MRQLATLIWILGWLATPSVAMGSDDSRWLLGTWWYANSAGQIIEGKDKDGMLFRSDGTVDLIDESANPYLNCTFTDRFPGKIRIDCIVRNEPRALIFVIAADRTRLARVGDVDKGFYRRAE